MRDSGGRRGGGRGEGRRAGPVRLETLRVERLAGAGLGVARCASGEVVLVERVAVGDLAEVEVAPGRPARGVVRRLLEPSPDRVPPPCPHVERCGGCDWMHLSETAQRNAHADLVRQAFGPKFPTGLPTVRVTPAPRAFGYRTRTRLHVHARGGRVLVGYLRRASHEVLTIDTCAVLDPRLDAAREAVTAWLVGAEGRGTVSLALGRGDRPVVAIEWQGTLAATTFGEADRGVGAGRFAGARIALEGMSVPSLFGDPRPVMDAGDGASFVAGADGFAQASAVGGRLLAGRVRELAAPAGRRVVELFAGSGTLSVALAPDAASFVAVEQDAGGIAALRENLAARGLAAKVVAADANAYPIPARTEVVVLDPPRTGAPGAARAVVAARVPRVVYVGCDPATAARDAATLGPEYRLDALETLELFPQTSHVETLALLVRRPR